MFPIMGIYEGLAAELACQRMTEADLARLEDMHARMVAHWKNGRWERLFQAEPRHSRGHLRHRRQRHAEPAVSPADGAHYAIRFIARKTPERWAEAVADHEAIMAAFRARDAARLFALLREHLATRPMS